MGRDSSDGRTLLLLALIVLGGVAYRALSLNPDFCDTNSDNLQLKELSNLTADSSSVTNRDLLNTSYWSLVGSSVKDTMGGLLSNTYLGFLNNSQEWRNWSLHHFSNYSLSGRVSIGTLIHCQIGRLRSGVYRDGQTPDS